MARLTKAEQLEREKLLKQGLKRCPKCEIVKSVDEFSKWKGTKDGLQTYCKSCSSKYFQSEKGKKAIAKYQQSEKGKKTQAKAKAKYQQSEKGKKAIAKYWQSEKGKKSTQRGANNRKARKMALPNTLTPEQQNEIYSTFDNKCPLTGNSENLNLEHFIPLSILHGGTCFGNLYPCDASLNMSKSNKNPLKWIQKQPEQIRRNFHQKVLPVLAKQNGMTVVEFKKFTNWCFKNKRTLEQAQADLEKGLTSVDLFWQAMGKE